MCGSRLPEGSRATGTRAEAGGLGAQGKASTAPSLARLISYGVVSSPSLEVYKRQHQVLEKGLELCTGLHFPIKGFPFSSQDLGMAQGHRQGLKGAVPPSQAVPPLGANH